ncbi:MAG: hypothetical protein LDLANPLL_00772 [Turneriella sp.]|nr:hypothetical protein [Turneriella sp.]
MQPKISPQPKMNTSSIAYRNDLQGLRALAVIAVLFFHIWPDSFRGGFIGVDVFFVISGFLITTLLIVEIEKTGRLDLGNFWARRMRRLLPAATLVIIVSLFLAFKYMPETDWLNTTKQAFASSLYFQNWMLVLQSVDYMAREASATLVQHYWSLSIEEQFYIAWPLIIFLAVAIGRGTLRSIRSVALIFSTVILVASFSISAFVYLGAPHGYFTSTTRAWELSLGATLAILWPRIQLDPIFRVILSWVGLTLVVASVFVIKQDQNFPGYIALLPTFGTVFLILGNQASGAAGTLLGYQPMRFVGDISYAVYLWHWPLVVVSKQIPEIAKLSSGLQAAFIIATTFILSILTKYFVEDPFRTGVLTFGLRTKNRKIFVRSSIITALCLILLSSSLSTYKWIEEDKRWTELKNREKEIIHPPDDYPGARAMDAVNPAPVPEGKKVIPNPTIAEYNMDGKHAHCMGLTGSYAIRPCEFGNRNGERFIVLAGDSHAMQYGTALEKVATLHNWRLLVLTKPACPFGEFPVYYEGWERAECTFWKKEVLKLITAQKPDLLIIGTARAGLFGQIASPEKQIAGYKSYWQKFLDAGIRVAVIRDNPLMRGGKYSYMTPAGCVLSRSKSVSDCKNPRKKALESLKDYLVTVQEAMKDTVSLIDLSNYFCDAEFCYSVIGNILVYRDYHHITDVYGKTLAPYLDKIVQNLLKKPAPTPVSVQQQAPLNQP